MADPINISGLTALAMQLAADYYNQQLSVALDEVFPGTYAWQPEGVHDLIWSVSERAKQGSLRVMKTQWNQMIKEFQHSSPPMSGFSNVPKGVGGPSVAQSWRDSIEDIGINEVQTLTETGNPTSGTFTLSFQGQVTTNLNWNAVASDVQTALQALSTIGSGNVSCSGGPFPGSVITVTFTGALSGSSQPLIQLNNNNLAGGNNPTVTIAETTQGKKTGNLKLQLVTDLKQGDTAACFRNVHFLPTQNRWAGIIDNERILFEGTSGGIPEYFTQAGGTPGVYYPCSGCSGYHVDIVYRAIDNTLEAFHSGQCKNNSDGTVWYSGVIGNQSLPDTVYGVNLSTFEKSQFLYPHEWTSGGIQGTRIVPQIQTVECLDNVGEAITSGMPLTSGMTYFSGQVKTPDTTVVPEPWRVKEFVWLIERNNGSLSADTNYEGQFIGYSPSLSARQEVQTLTITGSPTGGTFRLFFKDPINDRTDPIMWNAAATDVQNALTALANIGNGGLTCTGGPLPNNSITITFTGNSPQSLIQVALNSLTGGTNPLITITEATLGRGEGLGVAPVYAVELGGGGAADRILVRLTAKTYTTGQYTAYSWTKVIDNNFPTYPDYTDTSTTGGPGNNPAFEINNIDLAVPDYVYLRKGTGMIAGVNESQTLAETGSPNAGTFTLSFKGSITTALNWNLTATDLQAALVALPSIGIGNVSVTGGPFPGTNLVVNFQGGLANASQPLLVLNSNNLAGGTNPTVTITETTQGSAAGGSYYLIDEQPDWELVRKTGPADANGYFPAQLERYDQTSKQFIDVKSVLLIDASI